MSDFSDVEDRLSLLEDGKEQENMSRKELKRLKREKKLEDYTIAD